MAALASIFAPAKINLGLNITGRYANGYHRLETVFVPVPLGDRLQLLPASTDAIRHSWQRTTPVLQRRDLEQGTAKNPLLLKTLNAAREYFRKNFAIEIPQLHAHVEKHIPSPGGLGGASSDAAALIAALWTRFAATREIPPEFIAATEKLGADIPFFLLHGLEGRAARLTGIGHELAAVEIPRLCGWLCIPDFGFPTGQMFAEVRSWDLPLAEPVASQKAPGAESNLALRLNEIPYSDEPVRGVRVLRNDFDTAAAAVFPAESRMLFRAKLVIAQAATQFFPGEWAIGMTGSGAGLFAVTEQMIPMTRLTALKTTLKARLGQGWRVIPFRNIGP